MKLYCGLFAIESQIIYIFALIVIKGGCQYDISSHTLFLSAFFGELRGIQNYLIMRTFRLIGMALFAVLMCVNFASCSNDQNTPTTEEQEFYTVKLGWGGEILDITEKPLSRAINVDLYGIQVYSTPNKDGGNSSYNPYAYGLFDNPDSISINLLKGYKYKFVSTVVKNGKNRINWRGNGEYGNPFDCYGTTPSDIKITNDFKYSASAYMTGLERGNSWSDTEQTFVERPNLDRYYGELNDFIPAVNKTASISMKRASFGATFVAINSIAKNGVLEIQLANAPKMEIDFTTGQLDEFGVKDIFTFYEVAAAFAKDDYTETIPVTINWHRADGGTVPLGSHNITYKRNRNTTVTVLIKKADLDSKLGISIEDSEQNDIDNMINDGNTTIEDGEIVTTPVNPN